jgi:hypothetical protein
MFNKSEHEVAVECAVLNAKLRFHEGGHLNGTEENRSVVLAVQPASVTHPNYLELIMGFLAVLLSFILIDKLFSK